MDIQAFIRDVSIAVIPFLFAIAGHEAAHAYVARYFGDPTADRAGRISLNPIRHIDLVGTIAFPLLLLALGSKPFGWAKPVPVDFRRLRNPKRDMLWVAAAGPFANLLMAIFWLLLLKIIILSDLVSYQAGLGVGTTLAMMLGAMCFYGVFINAILMIFNLLPLPPLDGGRIVTSLLPHPYDIYFAKLEPFGFPILLLLVFTGGLSNILGPLVKKVDDILYIFL